MKEYKVYANINPLEPNTLVCVWSSTKYMSSNDSECWNAAKQKAKVLKDKGYRVSLYEVITTRYDI